MRFVEINTGVFINPAQVYKVIERPVGSEVKVVVFSQYGTGEISKYSLKKTLKLLDDSPEVI